MTDEALQYCENDVLTMRDAFVEYKHFMKRYHKLVLDNEKLVYYVIKKLGINIEEKEGTNLWNFAYCGSNMVSVTTKRGSAEVNATGIGGDFFFFHRAYFVKASAGLTV